MKKFRLLFVVILFSSFSYGQQPLTYTNPILSGFYPDPSICRVGNDYYIVNSSFAYFPGLPLFHSTDLVNWKQIGNAMDRKEQLDLANAGVSRGLFAPSITYHDGTFYIICTLIDKGGNFVITAKDPKGPWSNPSWLGQLNGIDPSLFFDESGKAFIVYNSIAPDNKSLYNGHRTIRMVEFDAGTMKVIGENKIIVNGGTDLSKEPIWIEAPHIFKKDEWYYLICAEGGTGYNHSEVVFRSKTVEGPYVPWEKNPILTQRHLDKTRENPITTTGHAEFVQAPDGKWYAIFLGCRPYDSDYYNTGRETFMTPLEWKDGWPVILEGNAEVKYRYPVPMPQATKAVINNFNGNLYFKDEFKEPALNYRYLFLRNPVATVYSLPVKKGFLTLYLQRQTASGKESPAFVGFRQSNLKGYAATEMDFNAFTRSEKAGLMIFQNETHYYFLCKSTENDQPVIQLYRSPSKAGEAEELLATQKLDSKKNVYLKIEAKGGKYDFYFAEKKDKWQLLKDNIDGKFLSTSQAGGFVGSVFALYATSNGKPSNVSAAFDWFEYKGDDDVFK
ncbi:MAG: glycoside hydrolase family 43 protein [Chitinophagaceae bacterium]